MLLYAFNFAIGPTGAQFAVVGAGADVEPYFSFNNVTSQTQLLQAIAQIPTTTTTTVTPNLNR